MTRTFKYGQVAGKSGILDSRDSRYAKVSGPATNVETPRRQDQTPLEEKRLEAMKRNNSDNRQNGLLSLADKTAACLREEIRQGKYRLGERLSDEHSLAQHFGVSRGTIRQALSILGRERLIVRQQGRGTFVSNPTFGDVVDRQAALLGVMVYEKEYYFGRILQGAAARAASRGYMLITGSNAQLEEETQHTEAFLKNAVAGVILSPRPHLNQPNYDKLRQAKTPVVMLDTTLPGCVEDFVSVDNYLGAYLATRHLIELGHRRLAYCGHSNVRDVPCRSERHRGFYDACEQAGIAVPQNWQMEAAWDDYSAALRTVLEAPERPTGFVTFNDSHAIRVIKEARALGISVPKDISVVGFDDSEMSQHYDVPLTTVHPEFDVIGATAVDLLIEHIETGPIKYKRSIVISPRLIVRESTGPNPA